MEAHQQLLEAGVSALRAGRLDNARLSFEEVLRSVPSQADSIMWLGILHLRQRDLPRAVSLLRRAADLMPLDPRSHTKLGMALIEVGDASAAIHSFDRALKLAPKVTGLFDWRGRALLEAGRTAEAMADFRRAIELEPGNAGFHNNAGDALMKSGDPAAALRYFDTASKLSPDGAVPLNNRGYALLELQRPEEALASCLQALRIAPGYVEALHNSGCALLDLNRPWDAITALEGALALNPTYVKSLMNLGIAKRLVGAYMESARCFERALELAPDRPFALGALILSLRHACEWTNLSELEERLRTALSQDEQPADASELHLLCESPEIHYLNARSQMRRRFPGPTNHQDGSAVRRSDDRLVVAYLSSDFHDHATAHLMAELFEKHDRRKFKVIAVSFGVDDSSRMLARLRASFEEFIDVRGITDRGIAELVRRAGVQIAIDLKGLTHGNRIGVFAQRCAPLQVSYLGYPGTTGAEFMDYVIADHILIPEQDRRWYAEKIIYMPDTYQVNDTRREISSKAVNRADFGLPENSFVYCAFNASYKISPEFFCVWTRLLAKVPSSVLWLLDSNPEATRRLIQVAESRGIARDRLVFAERVTAAEHIARYRFADLFLDTLPVGAHTTASEALWAGLPVLTCLGKSFSGRVAASIVAAANLPELVTSTMDEYEKVAQSLAMEPASLRRLRDRLAAGRMDCPLFDVDRFRAHIESAYELIWARHARGESPAHLSISSA